MYMSYRNLPVFRVSQVVNAIEEEKGRVRTALESMFGVRVTAQDCGDTKSPSGGDQNYLCNNDSALLGVSVNATQCNKVQWRKLSTGCRGGDYLHSLFVMFHGGIAVDPSAAECQNAIVPRPGTG
jgi:hypothetical protein